MYEDQNIIPVYNDREMRKSYIDYAMSVIVSRALPDVRDGLKPVHRRILYTMFDAGLTHDKPYRKCATTVGDVLGHYHPHGDASVYDALVRLAQDFSLRYPLVDGHGNFGSIDGDPPAAYRYTEARMGKLADEMLTDIRKDTVDFIPNFDDQTTEPTVLPSRFPNMLVNGSTGIAVGMATNMPPHNLRETIAAICATIDNPEITIEELMEILPGPDVPTGAYIMGTKGIRDAYTTGRGKIIMRARAEIEEKGNHQQIVITEIPYGVNKARMIEKMAELYRDKKLEGIAALRDESNREGIRVVIDVKRDANAEVLLNHLYKYTQLQETFGVIMLALVDGQPKVLNLRQLIDEYVSFQKSVIIRRTRFDLKKAEARMHILEGLLKALDHIDAVIKTIRESYDDAKANLMERFDLSDLQAQAILDMRLARLSGLEREKLESEYTELEENIRRYHEILANEQLVLDIIKEDLNEIGNRFGDKRRTELKPLMDEIDIEDLIEEEDVAITLTHFGYAKRLPAETYRSQHRGGKGISGLSTREEDFVKHLFVCSSHSYILFFTTKGKMFRLKAYEIPEAGRTAKGQAIVNLLSLDADEKISAMIPLNDFEEDKYLMMTTRMGTIKKTHLSEYKNGRKMGLNAIRLDEGDELIDVSLTDGSQDLIIVTHNGMAIRFSEADARPMGRVTHGVRGIRLRGDDYVVGVSHTAENATIMVVTENGFGKKTAFEDYRQQSRGGVGVTTYRINEKTGKVIGTITVTDADDLMMIASDGTILRLKTSEVNTIGRVTSGVRLMRLSDEIKVVSITTALTETEETDSEGTNEESSN